MQLGTTSIALPGRGRSCKRFLAPVELACFVTIGLTACSSTHVFRGIPVSESAVLITAVPPLLQDKRLSCGPTCVAAVAGYWDVDYAPLFSAELSESVKGNLGGQDLARLANLLRMQHHLFRGDFSDLEQNLQKGRPLLALVPSPEYEACVTVTANGFPLREIWHWLVPKGSHWVVVIGYSKNKIIFHDPREGRVAVSRSKFEGWWKDRKNTCLLLLPPTSDSDSSSPIPR